jgi:hypothetical protein
MMTTGRSSLVAYSLVAGGPMIGVAAGVGPAESGVDSRPAVASCQWKFADRLRTVHNDLPTIDNRQHRSEPTAPAMCRPDAPKTAF